MLALEVYAFLLIAGIANGSSLIGEKTKEADIFVNTFIDYFISLMRMAIPEPIQMNKSPNNLITLKNASIYGLRHVIRSCPVKLNTYSTPENDYINCILCMDLKDYFKVDGLFQISTFLYDTEFTPAILQLFNFTVNFNLTLTLPKVYQNTTEALLHLDGTPRVEVSRLQFTSPPDVDEGTAFGFLSDLTNILSSGPFGGYIEAQIGKSIRNAIKIVNQKMQKTVEKLVNKLF
nr:conserved hypothetical protein [Hymenolepis microstoma]